MPSGNGNFDSAIEYLRQLGEKQLRLADRLRLDRIRLLLDRLGNPQDNFSSVIVGGTSGKGSTSAMLSYMLAEHGLTGLTVSPHLQSPRERLVFNNELISKREFADIVLYAAPIAGEVSHAGFGHPTYFEFLIACAFEFFKRKEARYAVVEVGLGGKYDATNILDADVSVLTNVSLDHTEILGDTVEQIANDKIGIAKNGRPLVTGVTQQSVKHIIVNACEQTRSPLYLLGREFSAQNVKSSFGGNQFDLESRSPQLKRMMGVFTSLVGECQVQNAALALAAAQLALGKQFDNKLALEGLRKTKITGRFEVVQTEPLVILDGAHSPAKAEALASTLEHNTKPPRILVIGIKRRKHVEGVLGPLLTLADHVVFTKSPIPTETIFLQGNSRAFTPEELAKLSSSCKSLEIEEDPVMAVEKALALASKAGATVCVTGSLYLVGRARDKWYPNMRDKWLTTTAQR